MNLKNFTLLCVEDNPYTLEQLNILLKDDVKEIYLAKDGAKGLEIFNTKRPDIVLTDINLPVINGLDLAKKIKNISKNKVPIVILSALDDKDTLMTSINIGVSYFIPKPLDVDILLNTLEKISKELQNRIDLMYMLEKEKNNLNRLAYFDTLTDLPNRLLYLNRLNQALNKAKREGSKLAHYFIDIDNFKNINDTYGHTGGDKVLKTFAKHIKDIIREEDTFARISGDEFALIVENIENDKVSENIAKKILEASSFPINYRGSTIRITCSIGVCIYPDYCDNKDDLILFSDQAMYNAKHNGKSSYCFANKG